MYLTRDHLFRLLGLDPNFSREISTQQASPRKRSQFVDTFAKGVEVEVEVGFLASATGELRLIAWIAILYSLTNGDLLPQWKTINGLDLPESFACTRGITAGKVARAVKKTSRYLRRTPLWG